jgi:hypothetical protein
MAATTTDPNTVTTPTTAPAAPTALAPARVSTGELDEPGRTLSVFSSEDAYKASLRMANALSQSTLVPKQYQGQGNIPNVLIAMELASRIGASVLMVMQNLDIIHGRPSWRAQFLIATLNASKRFTPLRFRWSGKEGALDWGCRAYAKDRENGEDCVGSLITMDMARAEGWSTKDGSKWRTMPEQMLMYRAAAFFTRVYAPELSLGIQTREEVIDTVGYEVPEVPAAIAPGNTKALEAALAGIVVAPTAEAPTAVDSDGVVQEPAAPAKGRGRTAKAAAPTEEPAAPAAPPSPPGDDEMGGRM